MTSNYESISSGTTHAEPLNLSSVPSSEEQNHLGGLNFHAEPTPPLTEVDIESPTFTVRIKSPAPLRDVADEARKLFENHIQPASGGRTGFSMDPAA